MLGEMLSGNHGRRFKMISPQASFRRKLEMRNFQAALTQRNDAQRERMSCPKIGLH